MTDKLCERLSAFHHKTLQRVLGINMFAVDRGRIKNEHLRNKLSVCNTADMIQLHWKTCTHAIKSIAKPKPSGLQAAAVLCRHPARAGHLSDWIYFTESEKDWNRTRNDCISHARKKCARLGTGVLSPATYSEWTVTTGPASF